MVAACFGYPGTGWSEQKQEYLSHKINLVSNEFNEPSMWPGTRYLRKVSLHIWRFLSFIVFKDNTNDNNDDDNDDDSSNDDNDS